MRLEGRPCCLWTLILLPPAEQGTRDLQSFRTKPNSQSGEAAGFDRATDEFSDGGTQSYNGPLLSIQRRASRRITAGGNYTWAHCISDKADTNGTGPAAGTSYQDPNNRNFDRGNCDSDRRHIFNVAAVAARPETLS